MTVTMRIGAALILGAAFLGIPALADDYSSTYGVATSDTMIQACLAKETDKKTTKTALEMQEYCLSQHPGQDREVRHNTRASNGVPHN